MQPNDLYNQRTDDVSQFVNPEKAAQVGGLDGFTFSLAERIAQQSKQRNFSRDVIGQAFNGTTPYQLMTEISNNAQAADTNAKKLENKRLELESNLAAMSPEQADDSNYRAALGAYEQMLQQIPQAPQLEQFGFSDTDKMMIGFALLMGANPSDAIGKFVQTKMGFIDIQNKQTQNQFDIEQSLYRDRLKGMGDIVDIENQRLNRDQFSLDRQFGLKSQNINRELGSVSRAIDDQRQRNAEDRMELQNFQDRLRDIYTRDGSDSESYRTNFDNYAAILARKRGITIKEAEDMLIRIAPGSKTQQTKNQEATIKERQEDRNQRKSATDATIAQREKARQDRVASDKRKAEQADRRIGIQQDRANNAGRGSGRGRGSRRPSTLDGNIDDDIQPLIPAGEPEIKVPSGMTTKEFNQLVKEIDKFESEIKTLREEQKLTTDKDARKKIEEKIQGIVVKRNARRNRLGINKDATWSAISGVIDIAQKAMSGQQPPSQNPAQKTTVKQPKNQKHKKDDAYGGFK